MRSNQRKRYLVDRDFQLRFFLSRWLIAIATASLVVALTTLYLYVFVYSSNRVHTQWSSHLTLFLMIPLIALVVILIRWAILISHKVTGSLYRIREEMRRVEAGNLWVRVNLRKGDQMETVAEILNRMLESVEKRVSADRRLAQSLAEEADALSGLLAESSPDSERLGEARSRLAAMREEMGHITQGFNLAPSGESKLSAEGAAN